jgi:hypothetical protein
LPSPDPEIREQVVARELQEKAGEVNGELVAYLASRPADSVRAVQGLVQRVLEAAESKNARATAVLAREVLEGSAARATAPRPRRPAVPRSSGLIAPTAGGARSREKMVWDWPEIGDRVVEEWR